MSTTGCDKRPFRYSGCWAVKPARRGGEVIKERRIEGRKDPKTGKLTKPTLRYDVRYRGPDGKERSKTFRSKKEAERYERAQRTALDQGTWLDPRKASETFSAYANRWLQERHELKARTAELYRSLLRVHLLPTFGAMSLGKLSAQSSAVRTWNAELARQHPITAAKAYRLLSQLCSTAVRDGVIGRSPCNVKGAGQDHSPDRPTATVAEVAALAEAMPLGQRFIVLLAAWCQLRRGELLGLQRNDFDLLHGNNTNRTRRQLRRWGSTGGASQDTGWHQDAEDTAVPNARDRGTPPPTRRSRG